MSNKINFSWKRVPKQARSRANVDAMIEATAQLLAERGYTGLTTNHIADRAGVGIGTVYDFFYSKDGLVAEAASLLFDDVLTRMREALDQLEPSGSVEDNMRFWIHAMSDAVAAHKGAFRTLYLEVPYFRELPAFQALPPKLLQLALMGQDYLVDARLFEWGDARLYLIITMVGGMVIEMTVNPPAAFSHDELVKNLADLIAMWTRAAVNELGTPPA